MCHEQGPACHATPERAQGDICELMGNGYIRPMARTWGAAIRLCVQESGPDALRHETEKGVCPDSISAPVNSLPVLFRLSPGFNQ